MSRRRGKNRRGKARLDSPEQTVKAAAPEAAAAMPDKETGETRSLRSRLGTFAVVLGIQLALLGFFYAMAAAYPAQAKITVDDQVCLPNGTVNVTIRIRYGLPALLRSTPGNMVVRIDLQGEEPLHREVEPSSRLSIDLSAPATPGIYTIKIEADPDGSAGIGPLKTSAVLKVVATEKLSSP